jgi:tetratricopeptide (TPR) repeat protein
MIRRSIVLAVTLAALAARVAAYEDGAAERARGLLLVGAGRLAEAEAALRASVVLDGARDADRAQPLVSIRQRLISTLDVLSSLVAVRGELDEAEALLRRAVAIGDAPPSLPPVDRARVANSLARLLVERGAIREGDRFASRARKLYEKTRGPEHVELAEALSTQGAGRAARGDLEEAEVLLLRASRLAELENARPAVKAAAVANVGALRMLQGRYHEAEPLLERALELGEEALGGPDHPALIRLMQTLADCYRVRNRAQEAATLYEGALRISDRAYGARRPAALPSLSGMALVEEQRGNGARAEALHREALALAEEALGPRDPGRAEMLGNLASFYARRGEEGAAEHLFVRALAVLEPLGARDPRRTVVLQGLASLYQTQGRRADAARIERALAPPRAMLSLGTGIPPAEEH